MNILETLDETIASLTELRQRAAAGQVDEGALQSLLNSGLLGSVLAHESVRSCSTEPGVAEATAQLPPAETLPGEVTPDAGVTPSPQRDEAAGAAAQSVDAGEAATEETGDVPDEAPDETPPAAHAEAEALVVSFAEMPAVLAKLRVAVPAQAADFCKKAGRAASGLPEDEKKGELLASLLFKALTIIDGVQQTLIWSAQWTGVRSALDALRIPMAEFLGRAHKLVFVPGVELQRIDPNEPSAGSSIDWLPADQPDGTVLAVVSRGFERDGVAGGQTHLIVARGEPGELRSRLLEIWQNVETDGVSESSTDLAKLSRWIGELQDGDQVALTSTARHVLNLVHDRNGTGAQVADEKWLLAYLATQGISLLTAKIGRRFDDSYSPSKYERHLVYADEPAGTIVRIVTLGLADSEGIPLQKAVLGVSRGNE
ncbi:MAG: hypothetical protein ACI9EF_001528 [Pseudohongiellaceae bacterium]|jgi:hypothetical protein